MPKRKKSTVKSEISHESEQDSIQPDSVDVKEEKHSPDTAARGELQRLQLRFKDKSRRKLCMSPLLKGQSGKNLRRKQRKGKKLRGAATAKIKKEEQEEDASVNKNSRDEGVVKTVLMKGKAPVDSECKEKVGKAHVYCEFNNVYDVMLNQTNIQFNNNKYYLIQLLEDDKAKIYSVWIRWGRVGKVGQNSLKMFGSDLAQAKEFFKKKFTDKTRNEWEDRVRFVKHDGKYDMVHMDYSVNDAEDRKSKSSSPVQKQPSQLDHRVQALLELICDIKAMENYVLQMNIDIQKAPLGKLTVEQIQAGYAALKVIEECIKKKSARKMLQEACNKFYTRIPHNFGMRSPPLIQSSEDIKEKISLLEALSDIQIAVKMVESDSQSVEHPLDRQYHALKCQLQPLEHASHEFKVIENYLQSTHAPTHKEYTMTIMDIFAVERSGEREKFLSDLHNRTLLWHGSRLTNWVGILSQGLRVAPPEAPITGYMFGKGIYFADMSSKSANYCFATPQSTVGLLLLTEVALGNCSELLEADYKADKLPKGKHSTKGLGRTAPDPKNAVMMGDVAVLTGPFAKTDIASEDCYSLLYNEYVVYNPDQTLMRYLLQVKFNFSTLW